MHGGSSESCLPSRVSKEHVRGEEGTRGMSEEMHVQGDGGCKAKSYGG